MRLLAGRFELGESLGTGAMGIVHHASDRVTGEHLAVKQIRGVDELSTQRFLREGAVLARLEHPGIVRYHAHGIDEEGKPYLAMEWIEGQTLSDRLRAPVSVRDAVILGARLADALAAAHEAGVVHRDLKPTNVLLPQGDLARAKIVDFGVAQLRDASVRLTRSGVMVGTPAYMAPEQARGGDVVDGRADLFALGCLLYRAITGRAPFAGETLVSVLAKVLFDDPRPISALLAGVPAALDELVLRLLAKDRAARPSSAREVADALRSIDVARATVDAEPAHESAPASRHLTEEERRLVSIVIASPEDSSADGTTLLDDALGEQKEAVRRSVARIGGKLEWLTNGAALVMLRGRGGATEQAAHAARCALAIHRSLPHWSVAVGTGLARLDSGTPVGDVLDRIVLLPNRRGVSIDEVTAGLLDARFDVVERGDGTRSLDGERAAVLTARTLLGHPAPFVGREREIAMLRAAWESCLREPQASVVLLTGPPGVGKSRLRDELARSIAGEAEVWIGRGDPVTAGAPFGLVGRALRRAAGVHDDLGEQARRDHLQRLLARFVPPTDRPRVTAFVGEIAGVAFGDEDVELRAARGDAMIMHDQQLRAFGELVRAVGRTRPLLLVLEDLQWGDLPSVTLVEHALGVAADVPVMVLGVARPEVEQNFPRLWAQRDAQPIRVRELSKRASERMVKETLGDRATVAVVERVTALAEGNPFFLEELVRAVTEGRAQELPGSVLALVSERLERIDVTARRVLRAASVFGETFWEAGVAALLGESDAVAVHDVLEYLIAEELVAPRAESRFAHERELVFRHALVREAAWAALTADDRRLGHRLAATWLERAGEREWLVLAEHFEAAGEPSRAGAYFVRGAQHALAGNDLERALRSAERAVERHVEGDALAQAYLAMVDVYRWRAEHVLARSVAYDAMKASTKGSALWLQAVGEVALAAGRTASMDDIRSLGRLLLDLAVTPGLESAYAVAAARTCPQLTMLGDGELGEKLLARLLAIDRGALEPGALARVHQAKAIRESFAGEPEACLRDVREAERLFALSGDARSASSVRVNLGFTLLAMGLTEEAGRALRAAKVDAERLGLRSIALLAKHNLVLYHHRRGELAEARTLGEAVITGFRDQRDVRLEATTSMYLSWVLVGLGDAASAETVARRSLELCAEVPPHRPLAFASVAIALLAQGRDDEALDAARKGAEDLAAQGEMEEGEAIVRLTWAKALHRAGNVDDARAAISEAARVLRETASRFHDEALRQSYFEQVPENAETLALARAWE